MILFLNNTDSEDEEYSSDSSGDLPENNNVGVKYDVPKDYSDLRFLDQSRQDKYLQLRNELFTKQVEKGRIVFNTKYILDGSDDYKSEIDLVDRYKLNGIPNVIGFELIRASIKSASTDVYFAKCYKKNYMIHHPKMRILYVIDVVDPVIYLLNAMPKDTLRVILYIKLMI